MRLTTWNVNGIRNPFSYPPWNVARTFPAMFDILDADIVVMQELKIQRKDLRDDMVLLDGWDCYFSLPKQKKGISIIVQTENDTPLLIPYASSQATPESVSTHVMQPVRQFVPRRVSLAY